MACTYLELTISSIDIAAATSNSNVYPFLDNTVFVDYYDCYGNVVTEPFTVAGPYTASACTDYFIYGYPYLYYYNSDTIVSAINSTEAPGVPCIPPTPSPTETPTQTPTNTPTQTEAGCIYLQKFNYSTISCYTACTIDNSVDVYSNYNPPIVGLSIFYDNNSPCTNVLPDGYYSSATGIAPYGCYTISGGTGLLIDYYPCTIGKCFTLEIPNGTGVYPSELTDGVDDLYVDYLNNFGDTILLNMVTSMPYNTTINPGYNTYYICTDSGGYPYFRYGPLGSTVTLTNAIIFAGYGCTADGDCAPPPPTPSPTPTNTATPTNTPTNTTTPTVTPTNTATPTVTPSEPYDIYLFEECSNPSNQFRFENVPGTLSVGDVYSITGPYFNGIATVIT